MGAFFGACAYALRKLQQYNDGANTSDKRVNEKKMAKKAAKEAAIFNKKKLH